MSGSKPQIAVLTKPAVYPDWFELAARFGDQDPNRHVNNVEICRFIEEARITMRHDRMTKEAVSSTQEGCHFVVAGFQVRFLRAITYPARVSIGTVVTRIGRSSYQLAHGLFVAESCAVLGTSALVLCNSQTNKPMILPQPYRTALERISNQDPALLAAVESIS